MTITAMHPRSHGYNSLRALERRIPGAEPASATSSIVAAPSSSTDQPVYTKPPTSVAALAAVISVVGFLLILVFATWKFRTRRRKNRGDRSLTGGVIIEKERGFGEKQRIDPEGASIDMEKPKKVVLTSFTDDTHAGWVPQIKSYHAATEVTIPKPSAKSKRSSRTPQPFAKSFSENPLDGARSPPPPYVVANGGADHPSPHYIPAPAPASAPVTSPVSPTPPVNKKLKTGFSSLNKEALPTPSPRSSSFAPHDPAPPKEIVDGSSSGAGKLPRLMSVVTTFTPGLEDELAIKIEDTVRMLDEYRDGWCLVQHVGRIDALKGVVPRFCLQERRGVVPTRKFSTGSLQSQAWR